MTHLAVCALLPGYGLHGDLRPQGVKLEGAVAKFPSSCQGGWFIGVVWGCCLGTSGCLLPHGHGACRPLPPSSCLLRQQTQSPRAPAKGEGYSRFGLSRHASRERARSGGKKVLLNVRFIHFFPKKKGAPVASSPGVLRALVRLSSWTS